MGIPFSIWRQYEYAALSISTILDNYLFMMRRSLM